MLITLDNNRISLTVDTRGAQIMSLRDAFGCEYLWQGDPTYWSDRAPTLFPFIGRIWNNTYFFRGKSYQMGIHGFAAQMDFVPVEQGEDYTILSLTSNTATLVNYPFDFTLRITYRLINNAVKILYEVQNHCDATMPFGIGGHPGFRVPFAEGEKFEDYYLEFATSCQPDRIGFTPDVFLSGHDEAYSLDVNVNEKVSRALMNF